MGPTSSSELHVAIMTTSLHLDLALELPLVLLLEVGIDLDAAGRLVTVVLGLGCVSHGIVMFVNGQLSLPEEWGPS